MSSLLICQVWDLTIHVFAGLKLEECRPFDLYTDTCTCTLEYYISQNATLDCFTLDDLDSDYFSALSTWQNFMILNHHHVHTYCTF